MATSSTTPLLDWLVGFHKNIIYRIGQVGMEFGYTGNDGDINE